MRNVCGLGGAATMVSTSGWAVETVKHGNRTIPFALLCLRFPVVFADSASPESEWGVNRITRLCTGAMHPRSVHFFLLLVLGWPRFGRFCSMSNEHFCFK